MDNCFRTVAPTAPPISNGVKIGRINVAPLSDGYFRLDGGAMFGVVPRILWEKRMPPDTNNRIRMGLWCLLIQNGEKNIIVNTGIGNKYNSRYKEIFQIQHPSDLVSSLSEYNLKPTDIDIVILTHLHFDHCGGNTIYKESSGNKIVPTFPRARYIVQKEEWEKALEPNERSRASYLKENLLPIKEAGQLELINEDKEILDGISVKVTGGHTKGHQIVFIKSGDKTAVYWSDLIPTTAHIDLPYIMSYDLYPEQTLNEKKCLIEQAIKEQWVCFWEHDPLINCGYIQKDNSNQYKVLPLTK
ncbi:MAG: MBL fold metallo-hydrolase [Planctomycetota bacterium]|nr:MBL fold metallo-hydrolase [Planctomycetota bacterium]